MSSESLLPSPVGNHGTRRQYQAGCRCLPCRSAEAEYRAELRLAQAKGLLTGGQRVGCGMLWRRISSLQREGYSRADIARMLGLRKPSLQYDHERVTVRTQVKVERLYRWVVRGERSKVDRNRP